MNDKRLISRLINYWNDLRGDSPLPLWSKFNVSRFEDIWQQCCGWRVEPGDKNSIVYTYEYVGSSIKEAIGADLTGEMFTSHFRSFPGARIVKHIDEVVNSSTPLIEESQFVNENNQLIKYRSCLLPFGKETKVTNIVLALSWRGY